MRKTKFIVFGIVILFLLFGCAGRFDDGKEYVLVARLLSLGPPCLVGNEKVIPLVWEQEQSLRGDVLRVYFLTISYRKLTKTWRGWPATKIPEALVGNGISKNVKIRYRITCDGEEPLIRVLDLKVL